MTFNFIIQAGKNAEIKTKATTEKTTADFKYLVCRCFSLDLYKDDISSNKHLIGRFGVLPFV